MISCIPFITLRIIRFGFFFSFQTWPSFWLCWNDQTSQAKNRVLNRTLNGISKLKKNSIRDVQNFWEEFLRFFELPRNYFTKTWLFKIIPRWDHPMRLANERIFNSSAKCYFFQMRGFNTRNPKRKILTHFRANYFSDRSKQTVGGAKMVRV